ncbi:hypothetical protein A2767_00390 [Candidatus Roizmanbacteria bacterium RIFCSPHIGHO2_01_FULL_35_10]|uniref:Uncharacterized protein n=1 Tax=Candidatus Roizmanbacteria bacterium RIFCSPLOWO2_01_FULL_35_13 TaxID=1802055 RepID=A0A1F7IHG1_9BACT|nr:MAG: hypothetical protein A2767_00390 [Candidatus Roizmanbacteria bacterium RIFCSPHIGHO2_01_FULL_35_10]OGK42802.1 MAG: hypothetical protein A3A74_01160 [Candidatus Roizmanbacteria bacterium RIFCSPLOWO2_01_FULL_35_13]
MIATISADIKEEIDNYLKTKTNQEKIRATVISSYKLSAEEIAKIKASFAVINNLEVENQVDRSIMSGVIIKYGSYVIDLSIAGQLNKFKKLFYEIA